MNKYQEALDNLVHCKSITRCKECKHKNLCTMERDSKILQELTDKEKPMKVEYFYGFAKDEPYNAGCSKCGYILGKDFIPRQERDEYETAIYNVEEFRKELMEVLELIYSNRNNYLPPNILITDVNGYE